MSHIAVVVVSYNTRDLLRRCLISVVAAQVECAPDHRVTALVIDNASQDGSAAMVRGEFPAIRLVACDHNLGFTGGNNLALSMLGFAVTSLSLATQDRDPARLESPASPPDFVLLLNADAELQPGALPRMLACLASTPGGGVCGARLCYGDGRFQHGAFHFPGLFQIALDFFPLIGMPGAHRLHNSRLNGRYPMHLWEGRAPFPVDFVLGAAMLVAGPAICQTGGLDDRYFMYCEEMDWCLRLRDAGWQTYAAPDARVTHHEGQSSRQARWAAYERLWRSRFLFFDKHRRHYAPGFLTAMRLLVRTGIRCRSAMALRRFRRGQASGVETGAELATYAAVARL